MIAVGILGVFIVVWIFIIRDIRKAPLLDENFNIIKENKEQEK